MSLFDVIKYPISIPPNKEELEALPASIFDAWVYDNFGYEPPLNENLKARIIRFYINTDPYSSQIAFNELGILRKMIRLCSMNGVAVYSCMCLLRIR